MKTLIFDFGGVLVDWNPHYVFDSYFNDKEKCDYFIKNICNTEWNSQMDAGKPFAVAVAERSAEYPEWAPEIEYYWTHWRQMLDAAIPGMYELVKELKDKGYRIYGLTNWSSETFYTICDDFPVFSLLDGKVVSGDEKVIKPDPKIFNILLERFSLCPKDCIFIDDNMTNVNAAKALGIGGVQFESESQLRSYFESEGIL